MPPSTGRPTPVIKRAASEARNTTTSAMSETSPSRPSGVRPITAPGGHEPRVNAVHSHAVAELARLHRCDPGEPVDGGLSCRVAGDAWESDRGGHGRHVDYSATLARRTPGAHGPERVLDAECDTQDVHLEHPEEVLRVEVYDQFRDLDPGVVHHDVQAVEFVDRPCDRRLPVRLIGHVQWDEPGGCS